ncbi:MAG: YciI family protein [Leptospirales bacterium]
MSSETTAPLLLFTVVIQYLRPIEEVNKVVEEHRAYLDVILQQGTLLAAGPMVPRTGGILWMKAKSKSEIEGIVQKDPYYMTGVASFQILEFEPKRLVSGLHA